MLRISAKVEYACLAMMSLARLGGLEGPIRIREIASGHGIPERYLVQILLQLKGSGLVLSTRGASGGYRLSRPAEQIRLIEIISAIEGPTELIRDATTPNDPGLKSVWDEVRHEVRAVLDRTTLDQLAALNAPLEWII